MHVSRFQLICKLPFFSSMRATNASAIISGEYLPILLSFSRESRPFLNDIFCKRKGVGLKAEGIKRRDEENSRQRAAGRRTVTGTSVRSCGATPEELACHSTGQAGRGAVRLISEASYRSSRLYLGGMTHDAVPCQNPCAVETSGRHNQAIMNLFDGLDL